MINKVERSYLEINSIKDLKESKKPSNSFSIKIAESNDFQINKFFYKNVGKDHNWVDRLIWTDKQWIDYISNKRVSTYFLRKNDDLAGFFELIFHQELKEVEIAYLGLLEEYHNQKLGSYLLSAAIKNSFLNNPKRVWVHTCTLDHKHALNNYIARGMKIFKRETITI